ncbi:MAG TPA: bacillithiol biosynthesis deacetylase BshB1 [Gemmatimonadaceae bacterium]|jgi:bacillithiol biosynthesis deacetylase BshB1|nr:bacillithiol biosynthesis deacetylase BshB1 [Gemmatimonadaceae bacterium]
MSGPDSVDLLAIAAHRDDVELTCGGTLAKAVRAGHRVAILDLTRGEMGTRGSADRRAEEAERAARVLDIPVRENLALPDAAIVNDPPTRERLARAIRRFRPSIVIAPALEGRHPDHRVSAELIRDACFVAGLAKIAPDVPKHRPKKVLHCLAYRQDFIRPTFVVDVTDTFEQKMDAIRCYVSQFEGLTHAGEVYPNGEPLEQIVRHHGAYYGSLIRRGYGEPFFTTEMMLVADVVSLEVDTF